MPRLTHLQRWEVVRLAAMRRGDGRWRWPLIYIASLYGVTPQAVAQLHYSRTGVWRGRTENRVEPKRQERWCK